MGDSWKQLIDITKQNLDSVFQKLDWKDSRNGMLATIMSHQFWCLFTCPGLNKYRFPFAHPLPSQLCMSLVKDICMLHNEGMFKLFLMISGIVGGESLNVASGKTTDQTLKQVMVNVGQAHRNNWPIGMITNTFPEWQNRKVCKVEGKIGRGGSCTTFNHPAAETVLILPTDDC